MNGPSTPTALRCVSAVVPVYCDVERALSLVDALRRQVLPAGLDLEIIVVDDGSPDGGCERLGAALAGTATLLCMSVNGGRSATRNAGAAAARGQRLLFVDCDCLPSRPDFLSAHLMAWDQRVIASVGPVVGDGTGFWHRYQTAASRRRAHQHRQGMTFSGSSQNMMIDARAFARCGGFDAGFHHYGFEDRDLLLRLGASGTIAWAPDAVVQHMDHLSLELVCRKMAEAGEKSAALFSSRHPDAYKALGYDALDARQHLWMQLPARLLGATTAPLSRWVDRLIAMAFVPYSLKALLVKGLTAMSYLTGTARATRPALHGGRHR